MQQADQQFLEYVVKALVDNPDEVKTTRTVDELSRLAESLNSLVSRFKI